MTGVGESLKWAEIQLRAAGSDAARLDADWLLAFALGYTSRNQIYTHKEALTRVQKTAFEAAVDRRMTLEPVAYITGSTEFWSLEFKVTKDTLIPRPDSETLVDHVLPALREANQPRLLDLGTGSGCLLLSLLSELPAASGIGLDKSPAALVVAGRNGAALGLADRAEFRASDWFQALTPQDGKFDVILSNPPYIPTAECKKLMRDVRDYEPLSALDGGKDGLRDYRSICRSAKKWLKPQGTLAFECGFDQADELVALMGAAGFSSVTKVKDLAGIDRVVSGEMA